MSLDRRSQAELLRAELTSIFGPHHLTATRHTNQRNDTWLLHSERGAEAVVKWYRWLSEDAVAGVIDAEGRVRDTGVPVPGVLYRSTCRPLVAYTHVDGVHQIPSDPALVDTCAELFVWQLDALYGFLPTWTPARPSGLPRRAHEAASKCPDRQLVRAISESWHQLAQLAADQPAVASHADWRADNILFLDGQVAAVLDWEDVVLLPSAEAVGCGAGSLTHSWRETLYRPLAIPPVMRFLDAARQCLVWGPDSLEMVQARLAAFFTCAVRLAEDQQRGASVVTYDELRATLGG